ncbi:hypothetical protein M5V91_17025 [Cytobacillus pseudoceanisediminis]|uniref:hypothetical protein n=1 Tax=Cytobacillus pseudoceanisediminis TaxID=3051614 RepID=UPI0021867860|nr:hypothetical protein [Cytobacillus pseudoceanisediminis]UQX56871.1 hypothetical protein M5V91_17025 [Cytobacillus pseudoceanisediminis]
MGLPKERHSGYSQEVQKGSFLRDLTAENISSGIIASTLVMTGPALIILQAASAGDLLISRRLTGCLRFIFSGVYTASSCRFYIGFPLQEGIRLLERPFWRL